MAKKDKYVEDLGDGWVKVLGGNTKYRLSYWQGEGGTWELFKSKFQGQEGFTTDLVQTFILLTGKEIPSEKEPKVSKKTK